MNGDGEIAQLLDFVGPFSQRADQIKANIDLYEAEWRAQNPGREPRRKEFRTWDRRAWADDRPDKRTPEPADTTRSRWLRVLANLGYRDPARPVQLTLPLSGALDRDAAAAEVHARLAAAGSAWNAADVRGQVEQLLARTSVIAEPAVRMELAEDLAARALHHCVRLQDEPVAEHIRALTSQHVLDVEADLTGRFAVRAVIRARRHPITSDIALDVAQRAAAELLAGTAALAVVEGAAGAGKTTLLAAVRDAVQAKGERLVVLTPTLRAARVASGEVGVPAGSVAWLLYQYGWRWDDAGRWTRLHLGDTDPVTGATYTGPSQGAVLRRGDLVLVDLCRHARPGHCARAADRPG